jgi:hypothetical protein
MWRVYTNVLEEPDGGIFRVEDCRNLEDRCNAFFPRKVGACVPKYTVSHPKTLYLTVVTART